MRNQRKDVDEFLGLQHIAIVGMSHSPQHMSRLLMREFVKRGYVVSAVGAAESEVDGQRVYKHLRDIQPAPDGVLVTVAAEKSAQVVRDAVDIGIKKIWLYRAGGKGAVCPEAIDIASKDGCSLVAGECPLMFLPHSGLIHSLHRGIRTLARSLPA